MRPPKFAMIAIVVCAAATDAYPDEPVPEKSTAAKPVLRVLDNLERLGRELESRPPGTARVDDPSPPPSLAVGSKIMLSLIPQVRAALKNIPPHSMQDIAEMLDHDARYEPRFVKWTGPGKPQPVHLWESRPRNGALHYADFGGPPALLMCVQEDKGLIISKVFKDWGDVEDLSAADLSRFRRALSNDDVREFLIADGRLTVVREGRAAWGIYRMSEDPKWSILARSWRRRLQPVIREIVEGDGDQFRLKEDILIIPRNPSETLLSEARRMCSGFANDPQLLPIARGLSGFRLADMIRVNTERKSQDAKPTQP